MLRAHMRLLAALGTELRQHLVKLTLVPGVHVQLFGRQLQDCHDVIAGERWFLVEASTTRA